MLVRCGLYEWPLFVFGDIFVLLATFHVVLIFTNKIINFYYTSNKDYWHKPFATPKAINCHYLQELSKHSVLNLIIMGKLKACTVRKIIRLQTALRLLQWKHNQIENSNQYPFTAYHALRKFNISSKTSSSQISICFKFQDLLNILRSSSGCLHLLQCFLFPYVLPCICHSVSTQDVINRLGLPYFCYT
jgi:hypothetical protein